MTSTRLSDEARRRLLAVRGDPFLLADWERLVFLHFGMAADVLRRHVPRPFELELHEGEACVSLVAGTMRRFRPSGRASPWAWLFALNTRQSFLNVRTYVRCGEESGALFLRGWLSPPSHVPLPSGMFRLPYHFASLRFDHQPEAGEVRGSVSIRSAPGTFAYRATIPPHGRCDPCEPGTLEEFALERYTGFFVRGEERRIFRIWHPPWQQIALAANVEDASLMRAAFPWFDETRLIGASYAPGFPDVVLGRAHRLAWRPRLRRRALSTFFEMP